MALAYKDIDLNNKDLQTLQREEVENELIFLGFLIMENKLKSNTTEIINILNQAKIRTIMATGDNAMTAISVARECNLI